MTFIHEKINNASMQALAKKISPPTILSMSSMQVIDRDQDAILVSLGGRGELPKEMGEPPDFFAMLWQGSRIFFSGYNTLKTTEKGCIYELEMDTFSLPPGLKKREIETKQLIYEAMLCYAKSNWYVDVVLHFPMQHPKVVKKKNGIADAFRFCQRLVQRSWSSWR
jgi:hypothetical protein